MIARTAAPHRRQRGAAITEMVIVAPWFIFIVLCIWQAALVYYAKSSVNYATYEAARAGSINGASMTSITVAFQKAMLPYYGGGTTASELASTALRATADLDPVGLRIQILSPTVESFTDYNSPALQAALHQTEPVIPNTALDELLCPRDVPSCNSNPETNASGQTLLDANILKLRITYGIPPTRQMPMVGKFYTWVLTMLGAGTDDAFKQALLLAGRIPVVTSTVIRMQSDAVKNSSMISSPGKGNDGKPVPPDPGDPGPGVPQCPWWDPACSSCTGTSCLPETCGGH